MGNCSALTMSIVTIETQPQEHRVWPIQENECFSRSALITYFLILLNCSGLLSSGVAESLQNSFITLSSRVRLTRPPVFVIQASRLYKSTPQLQAQGTCRPATGAVF